MPAFFIAGSRVTAIHTIITNDQATSVTTGPSSIVLGMIILP